MISNDDNVETLTYYQRLITIQHIPHRLQLSIVIKLTRFYDNTISHSSFYNVAGRISTKHTLIRLLSSNSVFGLVH